MFKREFLRKAVDVSLNQTNALARTVGLAADRRDPQVSRTRSIDHGLRTIMIGRDYGCAIRHDQIAEQPQFGGEIMRDVRMVIHVVAREIGESAGRYAHAVQPILIEPVRRGLECQMADAVSGNLVELAMQRDRVRRQAAATVLVARRPRPG